MGCGTQVLHTFPPVWTIVAKPSGDHIPPGGFAAADGTPPFWHGTGKPPSKASAQSKGKPLGARRIFWPLGARMPPNGCRAMALAPALNQMVPPPVDNPPPGLQA